MNSEELENYRMKQIDEDQQIVDNEATFKSELFKICSNNFSLGPNGEIPPEGNDRGLIYNNNPQPPTMKDPLIPWRLEALKIAKDIALSIEGHFHATYDPAEGGGGKEKFDIHLQQVFEMADANLKYILGE